MATVKVTRRFASSASSNDSSTSSILSLVREVMSQSKSRRGGANRRARPTTVVDDFATLVRESQALRYKVHKPDCECPKVLKVKENLRDYDSKRTGFWIVPENPRIVFNYAVDKALGDYENEPLDHEKALFQEISYREQLTDIQVTGAQCLLQLQPNAFMVVLGSREMVDQARDEARLNSSKQKKLNSDHAHHICTLPISQLKRGVKRRGHMEEMREELLAEGVLEAADKGIVLGHHVESALAVFTDSPVSSYILALVYDEGEKLKIDVPGGKRNIGESSFECLVRESFEEVSLNISESWLCERSPRRGHGMDSCNTYYLARPPHTEDVENLAQILKSALKLEKD